MRKLILVFLLITGMVATLSAQNYRYYYYEPYTTAAEAQFNNPKPGKAKVNFHFFGLGKGRLTLELVSIKQLSFLPDLDSILTVAKSAILQVSDSLKQDAFNRKMEMVIYPKTPVQLRIISHTNRPPAFFIQKNELALLKTEQDTLRIKFMTPVNSKTKEVNIDGKKEQVRETAPAFITILVNNFEDIQSLPPDIMQRCLNLLKQDITPGYLEKANSLAKYTAYYNLSVSRRFSPQKTKYIKYGRYRNELVPNIYGSLQFARGNFAPSMAAGLRFSTFRTTNTTNRFYLMWEPYFFFRRDAADKPITERNDFVTFRYIQIDEDERKKGSFEYVGNFSIGYLTYRKGEWFEKNTWKLGLPGVRSGWLQLEPEFYFNNFFRNFSPTLKLTLHYE